MPFNRYLVNGDHERHFVVRHDTRGWDVIEKQDSTIVRHVRRRLWQGVEREIDRFAITADELKRRGWIEDRTDARGGSGVSPR
jgi:hypothetical protein